MSVEIRRMTREDVPEVGRIGVEAFNELMARHNRPPLYPNPQVGPLAATAYLSIDPEHSLVATEQGKVVGSVFYRRRGDTVSVGPATVAPAAQGRGVGSRLFQRVIDDEPQARSMRIMQDSLNLPSFELLVRIGYSLGEEVAMFTLPEGSREERDGDAAVRAARAEDLPEILEMDRRRFGSDRRRDFEFLRRFGKILTIHGEGRLQGYLAQMPTPGRTMLGPGGAESSQALQRLIRGAVGETLGELSLVLPARSQEGVKALLGLGFRLVGLSNLMYRGHWQPPAGAYAYSLFPESH
ncbi:MAG: GNAT family N-acetyltransferase [Deltaproteobacteria bacterium]|nr:GNAT family N-acetyltransferase [Deltaproteobacteria bacterium]